MIRPPASGPLHNEVEGVNARGTQEQIVKALLSKPALKVTGRYVERMYMERKAAVYKQDVGEDSESETEDEWDIYQIKLNDSTVYDMLFDTIFWSWFYTESGVE